MRANHNVVESLKAQLREAYPHAPEYVFTIATRDLDQARADGFAISRAEEEVIQALRACAPGVQDLLVAQALDIASDHPGAAGAPNVAGPAPSMMEVVAAHLRPASLGLTDSEQAFLVALRACTAYQREQVSQAVFAGTAPATFGSVVRFEGRRAPAAA